MKFKNYHKRIVDYTIRTIGKIGGSYNIYSYFDRIMTINLTFDCNLNCSYCYAAGLKNTYPDGFDKRSLKRVINWMKNNNMNCLSLLGGEPTQHPSFIEFLKILKKNNIPVRLNTNALFPKKIKESLNDKIIQSIGINYNPPDFYKRSQLQKFRSNLAHLYKNNIPFQLCVKLSTEPYNPKDLIRLANKYNSTVWISPFIDSSKVFTNRKNLNKLGRNVMQLVNTLERNNIDYVFIRAFPRCIFYKKEWNKLRKKSMMRSVCEMGNHGNYAFRMIVNPDLSVMACHGLFDKKANLNDYKSIRELSNYFEEYVKYLRQKPLMKECQKCAYFKTKQCQGFCLNYKANC
mgnify:CR=1 FL=1